MKKNFLIVSAVSVLLFAPSYLSADANRTEAPTVTQLFSVKLVKVEKQKAAKSRNYFGYIKAEDSRIVDVVPRFGGFVEKLYADTKYMKVKKGEKLVQVYSPEVLQAKEEYLNSLNYDSKRSSPGMLRSARTKLELLGLPAGEISTIKSSQSAAKLTTLRSPVNGWIFEKNINGGSAFKTGSKLFEIVDLDSVWVEAKIYQQDISLLKQLTEFRIKATGAGKTYSAKKLLLYPSLDPKEATATLRLEVDNTDGELKPGMYVSIDTSSEATEKLLLPRTAAIRKNGKWYAFLASEYEGEYEPVEIDVKPIDRNSYEVLSGLSEGDEVVDNSLFMMDSDAQINGLY